MAVDRRLVSPVVFYAISSCSKLLADSNETPTNSMIWLVKDVQLDKSITLRMLDWYRSERDEYMNKLICMPPSDRRDRSSSITDWSKHVHSQALVSKCKWIICSSNEHPS